MIMSICMRCAAIYRTQEETKPGIVFSHGYCLVCGLVVTDKLIEEVNLSDVVEPPHGMETLDR